MAEGGAPKELKLLEETTKQEDEELTVERPNRSRSVSSSSMKTYKLEIEHTERISSPMRRTPSRVSTPGSTSMKKVKSRLDLSHVVLRAPITLAHGELEELRVAFDSICLDGESCIPVEVLRQYLLTERQHVHSTQWSAEAWTEFIQFHTDTMLDDELHVYFEEFVSVLVTLKAMDSPDHPITTLFRTGSDAKFNLSVNRAAAGEIITIGGKPIHVIHFIYHGTARCYRLTHGESRVQTLVSLAPGQIFGLTELILNTDALMSLEMVTPGIIITLEAGHFKRAMELDSQLLWNSLAATCAEVRRIQHFVEAAPYLPRKSVTPPESDSEDATESKEFENDDATPQSTLFAAFGVTVPDDHPALSEVKLLHMAADSFVYRKGDISSEVWLLVSGRLDQDKSLRTPLGDDRLKLLGEGGFLTRQDRSRDLKCLSHCNLLRISGTGLQLLTELIGIDFAWRLATPLINHCVRLMASIDIGLKCRVYRSGETVIKEGDPADKLYVVVSGRLHCSGGHCDVHHPGTALGALSVLTDSEHRFSAVAVRDTEILQLSRQELDDLITANPESIGMILRPPSLRLERELSLLGVLSTDSRFQVDGLVEQLVLALKQFGTVRLVTGEMLRARFPTHGDAVMLTREISYYVARQELDYRFVVCLADLTPTPWTRWMLRQVDLVLSVGYADEDPRPTLERRLGLHSGSYTAARRLVLIHPAGAPAPVGTNRWKSARAGVLVHHVQEGRAADYQRLARVVAGKSVGLVLGGGGAKGVAHLGAVVALMENGVPIDYLGGCSIGGQMSALLARGLSVSEITEAINLFYYKGYFRTIGWDLTLPILGLMTGAAFSFRLKRMLGAKRKIEDLWVPFFTVSSNLTKRVLQIHDQGDVWHACRCSSSLPILFPPVETEQGLLMDGGFLNNLPTDVMKQVGADFVIGVDVGSKSQLPKMPALASGGVSGYRILFDWLIGKSEGYTNMVELLLYMTVFVDAQRDILPEDEHADIVISPDVASFDLLRWDAETQQQLFQRGYQATLAQLQALKRDNPSTYESIVGQVKYDPHMMKAYTYPHKNNVWRRVSVILSSAVFLVLVYRARDRVFGLFDGVRSELRLWLEFIFSR